MPAALCWLDNNNNNKRAHLLYISSCVAVGRPLVSVHVSGSETVVRGGQIQLVCKASGSSRTIGGAVRPRSVLWVKDGRQLSSEVRFSFNYQPIIIFL